MNCKITVPILAAFLVVASAVGGLARLAGGPSDVDVNALPKSVKDALQFAVTQYNHKSNALYSSKVTRTITAQQQVVAGIKYTITVDMARTSCRKGSVCSEQDEQPIGETKECTFVVWSRPWLNSMELTKDTTCLA